MYHAAMISFATPATAAARLGRMYGRRQFTLAAALAVLMLGLVCLAHASTSRTTMVTDGGLSPLPLAIPPTTPIKLRTSNGQVFDTTAATVSRSSVIAAQLDNVSPAEPSIIPLPANVTAASMTPVLSWLVHHQGTVFPSYDLIEFGLSKPKISNWDREFLDSLDNETLFAVVLAAHDLNLKPLMHMGTGQIARMIAGKTSKEISAMFNIEQEWTPEEEEEIRRENERAFQEL